VLALDTSMGRYADEGMDKRRWGSDAAYRRAQSHARFVRGLNLVYRGSGAFTIPYIEPAPQHVRAGHRV
jgi:hypothetical protein